MNRYGQESSGIPAAGFADIWGDVVNIQCRHKSGNMKVTYDAQHWMADLIEVMRTRTDKSESEAETALGDRNRRFL